MKETILKERMPEKNEELLNTLSHFVGLIFGVVAMILLPFYAEESHQTKIVVSCLVYAFTLAFMYLSSVLYHGTSSPNLKPHFKVLDHVSIYLLIAGTYTPFVLVDLGHTLGWFLFITIWILAGVGILLTLFLPKKMETYSIIIYLLMGWLILIAIKPFLYSVPLGAIIFLLAGGLFYSFGVIFYLLDKRFRYFHLLWHIFVIAASFLQFLAVWIYIIPNSIPTS